MPSYWFKAAFEGSHSRRIGCPVPITESSEGAASYGIQS